MLACGDAGAGAMVQTVRPEPIVPSAPAAGSGSAGTTSMTGNAGMAAPARPTSPPMASAGVGGGPSAGTGGSSAMSPAGGAGSDVSPAPGSAGSGGAAAAPTERFSFFVASLRAMRELSKSQDGFGGDLRFGETGEGAGLRGADKICATIAEQSMAGAGRKSWRAFLSAARAGSGGTKVNAIERIGDGPWYDRIGRLVAMNKQDLAGPRPASADDAIKNDLPNENGVPNHDPDGTGEVDNHDVLTGSNGLGMLASEDPRATCNDWTKSDPDTADSPQVGHSWGRDFGTGGGRGSTNPSGAGLGAAIGGGYNGTHWLESHGAPGCAPGVGLADTGFPDANATSVGAGGGYGAIYCFALQP
jgi:hypothetical protein